MHDFNGYRGDDITPTTRSDPNSRVGTTVREMPGSEPPRSRKVNGWPGPDVGEDGVGDCPLMGILVVG